MTEDGAPTGRSWPGPLQDRRVRRWVIGLAAAYAGYALALGVVAPRVAHEPVENAVGDLLGVDVSIDRISVNPFTLRLEFADIEVREREGALLLSARSLWANFELWKSIVGVVRVGAIGLDALEVHAELSESGELNLLALVPEDDADEPEDEPEDGDGRLFPIRVDEIHLSGGAIRLFDLSQAHLFVASMAPVDLVIHEISTVRDESARVRFEATSTRGIRIETEFEATLDPLAARGDLSLVGLRYNVIGDYLGPAFPVRPTAGEIDVHTDFAVEMSESGLVVSVEQGGIEARGWEAESDLAELASVGLERFAIEGFRLALADRSIGIESITLEGPHVAAVLPGEAAEEEAALVAPQTTETAEAQTTTTDPAVNPPGAESEWRLDVDRFAISNGRMGIALPEARDTPVVSVWPIEFEALGISSVPEDTIDVSLSITLPDEGAAASDTAASPEPARDANLTVRGSLGARPPSAKLEIEAKDVALAPWSPVVGFVPGIRIDRGRLDVRSTVDASLPASGSKPSGHVQTSLALRDFALLQRMNGRGKSRQLVGFERLEIERLRIGASGESLKVAAARVDQPEVIAVRDARGELNLAHLMASSSAAAEIESEMPAPSVDVRRIEITRGRLDYRDATTTRPFQVDVTDIAGSLERSPRAVGEAGGSVDFTGRVNSSAPVRVTGGFPAPDEMTLDVVLEGLAVSVLGPYFEQYIGSEVEQGKLHLDLHYEFDDRKMVGDNDVRFDSLVFGRRTGSPDALKLPVPLAFKLMTDTKGQARFDLPIKGDLDDPGFTLRGVVTAAFVKVIQQSLTSPLAVLQTAMPDLTRDQQTQLTFAPGSAELDEEQRQRLVDVATFLASKPKNRVAIKGRVDRRRDARALRKLEDVDKEDEEEALRSLGEARARSIRDELVDGLGLAAGRIFMRKVDLDGRADDGRIPVDVVLTDD